MSDMPTKKTLAKLSTLLKKPVADFMASPECKLLEQHPNVVKALEPLHLPEIKRLLCYSTVFAKEPWALPYEKARKRYEKAPDVQALLQTYPTATSWEENIVKYVDESILNQINQFFETKCKKEEEERQQKLTKLEKELKQTNENLKKLDTNKKETMQKENAFQGSDTDKQALEEQQKKQKKEQTERKKLEEKTKALEQEIQQLSESSSKFATEYAAHIAKTKDYLDTSTLNESRKKAYELLKKGIVTEPEEEQFIKRFVHNGALTEAEKTKLKSSTFCKNLLERLQQKQWQTVAVPVLVALSRQKVLDLNSSTLTKWMGDNSPLLETYLIDRYRKNPDSIENTQNRILVRQMIRSSVKDGKDHSGWWKLLYRSSHWQLVLQIAKEEKLDYLSAVVKLLHGVTDASIQAFFESLQEETETGYSFTVSEFLVAFFQQEALAQVAALEAYLQIQETTVYQLERAIARKQREVDRNRQELFAQLCYPIEGLERLASNLRFSGGKTECGTVANQLEHLMVDLREGLTKLGVAPLEDLDRWQWRKETTYDPQKHNIFRVPDNKNAKVQLKTLGFAYTDEDGEAEIRKAEVYDVEKELKSAVNKTRQKRKPTQKKQSQQATTPKQSSKPKKGETQ